MSEVIAWKFIGIYIRLLAVVIQIFYAHILYFLINSKYFFINLIESKRMRVFFQCVCTKRSLLPLNRYGFLVQWSIFKSPVNVIHKVINRLHNPLQLIRSLAHRNKKLIFLGLLSLSISFFGGERIDISNI